jgi:hypothetical protein
LFDSTPAELAKSDFKFRKWPELVYHTVKSPPQIQNKN